MFRPPEYAALINPAHNAFAIRIMNLPEGAMFKRGWAFPLSIEDIREFYGPKEWSPIGEYKLKETR